MDAESKRIWEMIGALSDARWKRIAKAERKLDALLEEKYPPDGDEEKAIWSELTAPHNHVALRHYVESQDPAQITEYALRLYQALLTEAARRVKESR